MRRRTTVYYTFDVKTVYQTYSDDELISIAPYGTTNANPFIPFFAYFNSKAFSKDGKKVLLYSPKLPYDFYIPNNNQRDIVGANLFVDMPSGLTSIHYVYDQKYITNKGCLFQVDDNMKVNFLIMTVIENQHFMNNIKLYNRLDESKMLLLVNNEVFDNPKHDSIKRRLKNYHEKTMKGIDMLRTSDIEKWCFNNVLENIKFKDVISMNKFISEIKSMRYGKSKKLHQQEDKKVSYSKYITWTTSGLLTTSSTTGSFYTNTLA